MQANAGTKLLNQDTNEAVQGVQKITYQASAKELIPKVVIELYDVPLDIITNAEIKIIQPYKKVDPIILNNEVKITHDLASSKVKAVTSSTIKINHAESNDPIRSITDFIWEATPTSQSLKMTKMSLSDEDTENFCKKVTETKENK